MYSVLSTITSTPAGVVPFWRAFPEEMKKIEEIILLVPGVVKIVKETINDSDVKVDVYFQSAADLNNWFDRVWAIPEFVHRFDYNVTNGISRIVSTSEVETLPDDQGSVG